MPSINRKQIRPKMEEYKAYTDVMYLMTGYLISDSDEHRYSQLDVFISENILFHTLEEAERKIAELAHEEELMNERACFFVYEVPVGVNCYHTEGQKIKSYTADGELNSESKVSSLEDNNGKLELFHGRDKISCKFSIGDRVAVFKGDHFSFETVYALPVDLDESKTFISDYSDDCYITIPERGEYYEQHNHPSVVNVFPIEGLLKLRQ